MKCPRCHKDMAYVGSHHCASDDGCGTCYIEKISTAAETMTISRAEYDRLVAVEAEYQRVSALVLGICESARDYSGADEYKPYSVQRLEYALKQIGELMEPAAIARAKGEGK